MKPTHHSSSLPATGPGSTYLDPVHVVSLPMAMQIAINRQCPIMCRIATDDGRVEVGRMFPSGVRGGGTQRVGGRGGAVSKCKTSI